PKSHLKPRACSWAPDEWPALTATLNSQCAIVSCKSLIEETYTYCQKRSYCNAGDACHKSKQRVCTYNKQRRQHPKRVEYSMKCTWPQNSPRLKSAIRHRKR